MTRGEVLAHVQRAQQRLSGRIAVVKSYERNTIAAAVRAFGRELEPVDYAKCEALIELADLLMVPREERLPPTPPPAPPDDEGDEALLVRRGRMRREEW